SLVGQENQSNILLRNNILWATAGYDIRTDAGSQANLVSDYNDLYATGPGGVGFWVGAARKTLADWQNVSFGDLNSLGADPQCVNLARADCHEKGLSGSAHGGSFAPALDAGTGLPVAVVGTFTADATQSPAIDRGQAGARVERG